MSEPVPADPTPAQETNVSQTTPDPRFDAAVRATQFARTTGATDEETARLILGAADEAAALKVFDAALAVEPAPLTLNVPVADLEPLISVALGEQPYTDEAMPDFGADVIDAWEGAAADVAERLRARLAEEAHDAR